MLARLGRKCDRKHVHQHLMEGRGKAAAYYPDQLVQQILRGIRDTADEEDRRASLPRGPHELPCHELVHAVTVAGSLADTDPAIVTQLEARDIEQKLQRLKIPVKHANGHVQHQSLTWKDTYRDECTNEALPHAHIKEAMADELSFLCREVFECVPMQDCLADPQHVLISGRWVNCNKEDATRPKCRGRYVAQEVNVGGEAEAAFYAATPPLEAKRLLMSMWAKQRQRGGHPLKIHCLDARKAYFNGTPNRSLYIRLPPELGMGKEVVGRLKKCIYGTRDAGAIWEATYTRVLKKLGFVQGTSSPCCFYHRARPGTVPVHGDASNTEKMCPGRNRGS